MPSYQTQMKGASDWSDPEPHSDYRAAAGLDRERVIEALSNLSTFSVKLLTCPEATS